MINFEKYDLEKEIEKIEKTPYSCRNFLDWYSHLKILTALYDLKNSKKLEARIYHGIFATDYEWNYTGAIESKVPVLCTRQSQVDFLIKHGRSKDKTFATGALFPLYAKLKNIQQAEDAEGTIVYPAHSGASTETSVDWQSYIDKLNELPDEFKPIHVCLHWRDIVKKRYKIFLQNGFKVYCAGHCRDKDFVDNYYEILRHHKYVSSNCATSSALVYAIDFGLPTFVYGRTSEQNAYDISQSNLLGRTKEEYINYLQENMEFFEKIIPEYPNINQSKESKEKINYLFGVGATSPKEDIEKALQKEINKRKLLSLFDYIFKIEKVLPKKGSKRAIHKKITILSFIKLSFKVK